LHDPYIFNSRLDRALKQGKEPLFYLGKCNVFSDIFYPYCGETESFDDENRIMKLENRRDFIELIDNTYPNSKFILNTRNKKDWIKSRKNMFNTIKL